MCKEDNTNLLFLQEEDNTNLLFLQEANHKNLQFLQDRIKMQIRQAEDSGALVKRGEYRTPGTGTMELRCSIRYVVSVWV